MSDKDKERISDFSLLDDHSSEVIDRLPLAVYVTDGEGRLTYFNKAAIDFAGYEPEPGTDQWCLDWTFLNADGTPMEEDECPMVVALKEKRSLKGTSAIAEFPDGRRVWFEAYSSPQFDENGEVTGGIHILVDVTERKVAEVQLQDSEKKYFDFFENAILSLHLMSPNGEILRANQANLDLLGYERDEYEGHNISEFHVHKKAVEFILNQLNDGKEVSNYEAQLRTKSGEIKHVLIDSNAYRENGKLIHSRCFIRDISKRKKAVQDLEEVTSETARQKRLFETILSNTPDLVYVIDLDYRFTYANDALLDMWGKPLEETVGKNFSELGYQPELTKKLINELNQVVATREQVTGQASYFHTTKQEERVYEYIFVPVIDTKGKVEAIAGTSRDVTERMRVEAALRESEGKYRSLFKKMEQGFCIIEILYDETDQPVDFRYLEVNDAFTDITGIEHAQGKTLREINPDIDTKWIDIYARVARTGESIQFNDSVNERWFDVYAFPIGNKGKRKVAFLFSDITVKKSAEIERERLLRELENEREKLLNIFQRAPSFMAILRGPDHVYERVNDMYKKIASRPDVEGKTVQEVLPEVAQIGLIKMLDRTYTTGESFTGTEIPLQLGEQQKYIDLTFQPLRDINGNIDGVFVQGIDLTERHEAKKELQEINETLEERVKERTADLISYQEQLRLLADRLSRAEENERQRLATELHDNLGQMLAISKMRVDILKMDPLPEPAASTISELSTLMDESIRYTRGLMTDLKPPPSIKKESLAAGLQWVANKMKKHDLDVEFADDQKPKPLKEEVRTTLRQCVRELLFNVVKHSEASEAELTVSSEEGDVQVTVRDKGVGFDPSQVTPFIDEHTGFGLFSVRERMNFLGGSMKVISAPGEGTSVILRAPLITKKKAPLPEKTQKEIEIAAEGLSVNTENMEEKDKVTVLLVDDHEMMRKGLKKMIDGQQDMMVIAEAADGKQAIGLARETGPDVIVMDVNMPVMDGIEATQHISREKPDIKIIGLSLHDSKDVSTAMRRSGASAYLSKSEAFETLCATIRSEAKTQTVAN